MSPALSVIICSLNGADGIGRCLDALDAQTVRPALELIVVDDGSTDSTSDIAKAHAVTLIQHTKRRGVSAARNSGIRAASAPIIAFLDDDCEPDPDWAENVIGQFDEQILALGGALIIPETSGIMLNYLNRHNPLAPQELELAKSRNLAYRLMLYLGRQWAAPQEHGRREVFAFAGGNMAVHRSMLLAIDGFDERILFGADDDDLLHRLARAFPDRPLIFDPDVRAAHHFETSLGDTLRRSRVYGRGRAMMYRKWSGTPPTIFPFPVITAVLLVLGLLFPYAALVAALLPQLFYPLGIRTAIRDRDARCLLDPYIQLAQEAWGNFGFAQGWVRFRNLHRDSPLPQGQLRLSATEHRDNDDCCPAFSCAQYDPAAPSDFATADPLSEKPGPRASSCHSPGPSATITYL